MATKDDEQRSKSDAPSADESRSSKDKFKGTMVGLGEEDVKASSPPAKSASADRDDEEVTTLKPPATTDKFKGTMLGMGEEKTKSPSSTPPAEAEAPRKFGGTMLGMGEEKTKSASSAPPAEPEAPRKLGGTMLGIGEEKTKSPSSTPPAGEREQPRKLGGTMLGMGEEKTKSASSSPPPAEPEGRKFGGTMLGMGESAKKDVGSAKTELAKAQEEAGTKDKPGDKKEGLGSTLVMEKSQPATEPRPTPKKAAAPPAVDKGKTLPLPIDVPAKPAAKSSSRPVEDASEPPPAAKKESSSLAPWLGLAAVAAVGAIWMFTRSSDEETPNTAEPTPTVEPAPAAAQELAKPAPEPAPEPVAAAAVAEAVVEPEPAAPSAKPAAPVPEEPKVKKQAPVREPAPPPAPKAVKPVREPARVAEIKAESAPATNSEGLSPSLAARVAVAKNTAASRCRQKPDPAGTVQALVTFAGSGQVTAVRVLDQYAATHTAACVEERLKEVTMASFSGESVTVRVPVQVY